MPTAPWYLDKIMPSKRKRKRCLRSSSSAIWQRCELSTASLHQRAGSKSNAWGVFLLRAGDRQGNQEQHLDYQKIYLDTDKWLCQFSDSRADIQPAISNLTKTDLAFGGGKRTEEEAGDRQQIELTLLTWLIIRVGTWKDSKNGGKQKNINDFCMFLPLHGAHQEVRDKSLVFCCWSIC